MKKLIFIFFISIFCLSFSEEYINGKILEKIENTNNYLENYEDEETDDVENMTSYKIQVKNNVIQVDQPVYKDKSLNFDFKTGDKIVLMKEKDDGDHDIYFITDKDKRGNYIWLSVVFVVLTLLIAKTKGIKGLLSLTLSVGSIFYFFLPLVIKGYSPILLSVITALFSAVVTIIFIAGFTKKGVVAILGSVGGVLFSGILSFYLVNSMRLTGYTTVEAVGFAEMLKGINLKELISAGIILGSMGAIMDVAMSISSSITEIYEHNPKISSWKLFLSGINIGRDIIGTMINTLILAYIGGSLFDILVIAINIKDLTFQRLLNFEFIAVEILKSFAGSIGILIAIPLTAYLGAHIISKLEKHKKD